MASMRHGTRYPDWLISANEAAAAIALDETTPVIVGTLSFRGTLGIVGTVDPMNALKWTVPHGLGTLFRSPSSIASCGAAASSPMPNTIGKSRTTTLASSPSPSLRTRATTSYLSPASRPKPSSTITSTVDPNLPAQR
jgi:hypothetical protein